MALIPHGVDTVQFRRLPHARRSLGIPDDRRLVLYVGRLSPEKGVQHLLEAIHLVSQTMPEVELHLVGDGPYRNRLAQMASELEIQEHVFLHGWISQPELPVYYSAADVTVLPSFSEGLPRTMIEAMACRSPFLGTTITGIVDHVEDGKTGFLVPPGDSQALAQKLQAILVDRRASRSVGRQGAEYVRRELAWEVIVRRVRAEVYQEAIRPRMSSTRCT
jgi:glycosyltransferase involved in cell wall biosynthesis